MIRQVIHTRSHRRRTLPVPAALGAAAGGTRALALAAAMALAAGPPLAAGSGTWTPIGPGGGYVTRLAIDPTNPAVLYAGTVSGGVFKSIDGAASWSAASRGLGDVRIYDLAIDPRQPSTVYAAANSGLWKSVDGAATWSATGLSFVNSPNEVLFSVAVDPHQPGTLYAGTDLNLWVSRDAGVGWSAAVGIPYASALLQVVPDPSSPAVFALAQGNVLLESLDAGAHWVQRGRLPHARNYDATSVLAIDPAPPGTLYLAFLVPLGGTRFQQETFQSADAGGSWHRVGPGGFPVGVGPRHVVYAGAYRSADGGATWRAASAPPDFTLGYTAGPPGTVYASTLNLGVVRSHDRARSWQAANAGLSATEVNAFAVAPRDSTLYASVPLQGLLKSAPAGSPWQLAGRGLPKNGDLLVGQLAIDPIDPANLYYGWSASLVPTGGLAASADAGASWTQLQPQPGLCINIRTLAVDPASPRTLYATGGLTVPCDALQACGAFKSTDGGADWSCLPLAGGATQIFVAPSAPAVLYALAAAFGVPAGTARLSRSADAGATWSAADGNLPARIQMLLDLAVDPTDAQRLFAVGSDGSIWSSTTGGSQWAVADHGLGAPAQFVAIDPHDPSRIYAAGGTLGVSRSTNGGRNWHPLVGGLPPLGFPFESFGPLLFDPGRPGTLYVSVPGHGIFSYSAP